MHTKEEKKDELHLIKHPYLTKKIKPEKFFSKQKGSGIFNLFIKAIMDEEEGAATLITLLKEFNLSKVDFSFRIKDSNKNICHLILEQITPANLILYLNVMVHIFSRDPNLIITKDFAQKYPIDYLKIDLFTPLEITVIRSLIADISLNQQNQSTDIQEHTSLEQQKIFNSYYSKHKSIYYHHRDSNTFKNSAHYLMESLTQHNATCCLSILSFILTKNYNLLEEKDYMNKTPLDYLSEKNIKPCIRENIVCLKGKSNRDIKNQIELCKLVIHIENECYASAEHILNTYNKDNDQFLNYPIYECDGSATGIVHYIVDHITNDNFLQLFPLLYLAIYKQGITASTKANIECYKPCHFIDAFALNPFAKILLQNFLVEYETESEFINNKDFTLLAASLFFQDFDGADDTLTDYKNEQKKFLINYIVKEQRQTFAHFILTLMEPHSFSPYSKSLENIITLQPELLTEKDCNGYKPIDYVHNKLPWLMDQQKVILSTILTQKKKNEQQPFIYYLKKSSSSFHSSGSFSKK
jgi:hypothetical protein